MLEPVLDVIVFDDMGSVVIVMGRMRVEIKAVVGFFLVLFFGSFFLRGGVSVSSMLGMLPGA